MKLAVKKNRKTMNNYTLIYEDFNGDVDIQSINADTLLEAKRICKAIYPVYKFLHNQ